jgi:hypothetical protein
MCILRLGFLAPDLTEAILNGKLRVPVTLEPFRHPIPLDWAEQREYLGMPAAYQNRSLDPSNTAAAKIIPFRAISIRPDLV